MTKRLEANIPYVRRTISADSICYASTAVVLFVDPTSRLWNESIILNISRVQFAPRFSVRKIAITSMKGRSTVTITTQRNLHSGVTDAELRY